MAQIELSFFSAPPAKKNDEGSEGDEHPKAPPVFTVGELVRGANRLLETRFCNLWVEGEVSNLKGGGTGHAFFTLKDDEACLPVAMWRSSVQRLRFALEDGQRLRVYGRLNIFSKAGRFQMVAERAEPIGLGALMLELEQRKKKLEAEGLFDPARKRRLPRWPRRIGVVTSAQGAAIHDILRVASNRCPSRILLSPAVVQGPEAPASLTAALERLCRHRQVDVIIIGRGGGSVEDLWAFNDESLARAVAACPIPIVSAVGHEVDVTLCDLVADVRAATPSQAAELVVPDLRSIAATLSHLERQLRRSFERLVLDERSRLATQTRRLHNTGLRLATRWRGPLTELRRRLEEHHPRARVRRDARTLEALSHRLATLGRALPRTGRRELEQLAKRLRGHASALPRRSRARLQAAQTALSLQGERLTAHDRARLERLVARLMSAGNNLPRASRLRLARAAGALQALSPLAVLERGYAVAVKPDGIVVTDAATVAVDDRLELRLRHGQIGVRVERVDREK